MAKNSDGVPADKLARYEELVATIPDLERKGATVPYTSLNGHMFSYLAKTGTLALRLPEPARQKFLDAYRTQLTTAYGVVQKEYVDVPDALLRNTAELQPYFAMSRAYVASLKPAPTTRPAKPGKVAKPAAKSAKPAAKSAKPAAKTAKPAAASKPKSSKR